MEIFRGSSIVKSFLSRVFLGLVFEKSARVENFANARSASMRSNDRYLCVFPLKVDIAWFVSDKVSFLFSPGLIV